MTDLVVLTGYAALVGVALPAALARARWTQRCPVVGVTLWQALSASFLVTIALLGIVIATPAGGRSHDLSGLLDSCAAVFHLQLDSAAGVVRAVGGLGLTASVVAWSIGSVARAVGASRGDRRRHATMLQLVGRPSPEYGAYLIDHAEPGVYCLPGRQPQIVVTTGALSALSHAELSAVLAHERAHIGGRHHLVLAAADALARAFPRLPLFEAARAQLAILVEMLADDVASRRHGRQTVAGALVTVAAGATPRLALAASGPGALLRVHRLLEPARPLPAPVAQLVAITAAVLPLLPLALSCPPLAGIT